MPDSPMNKNELRRLELMEARMALCAASIALTDWLDGQDLSQEISFTPHSVGWHTLRNFVRDVRLYKHYRDASRVPMQSELQQEVQHGSESDDPFPDLSPRGAA